MSEHYLSKSDFKLASSCATKLYYKKSKYPMTTEGCDYLEFLQHGGFIVGKIAQLIHPGGILIDKSNGARAAVQETAKQMQRACVTLFEAAFEFEGRLIIADVLRKNGNKIDLIEVKSKSFDSDENKRSLHDDGVNIFHGKKGALASKWIPYLEDIAYQTHVVRLCCPDAKVRPYLLMPDKARTTQIDRLASYFRIDDASEYDPEVLFDGDAEALIADGLMTLVDVTEEVEELLPEVIDRSELLLKYLRPKLRRAKPELSTSCKDCEFRVDEERSGFRECWGSLADSTPHLLELYQVGKLRQAQDLIDEKKSCLFDVDVSALHGAIGGRQSLQVNYTRRNEEHIATALQQIVRGAAYPLHFIDFETSRVAVPYHKGMHPYEQVAFQWSCHTVESPGSAPVHSGWLNIEDYYPNIQFARTLKAQIGTNGTVLMWAHHERSVLKDILSQMHKYGADADLEAWLHELTADGSRLLDMNKLTLHYYFHPEMKGRTSIKAVLPAVWRNDPTLRRLPEFERYVTYIDGELQNPYKALAPIQLEGLEFAVREGTAAMLAYQDLLYGRGRGDASAKKKLHDALWDYCALDTLSMVIIWKHWERLSH